MKFVTKQEFERAIATIELAVNNGQVKYGHHDNQLEIFKLRFSINDTSYDLVEMQSVSFVSPFVAAQNKLFALRALLTKAREETKLSAQAVEELEKQVSELGTLVPTLKE